MAIAATVHSMIQTSIVLQVGIVLSCVAFAFQWLILSTLAFHFRFSLSLFTLAFPTFPTLQHSQQTRQLLAQLSLCQFAVGAQAYT